MVSTAKTMVAITDSAYSYQLGDVNPISRFGRNVAIQMGEVHYVKMVTTWTFFSFSKL